MQTTKIFKVGRFLNKDAVQKINMYSYCENDPINYVDPSGLERVKHPPICIPDLDSGSELGPKAQDVSGPSMSLAEAFGIDVNFWDLLFDLPGTIKSLLDKGINPMILGNMLYFAALIYTYSSESTSNNEGSSSTAASAIGGCSDPSPRDPRNLLPNGAVPNPLVTLTINGITIRIFIDGNGKPYAQTDDSKGDNIVKGLNAGFDWLWNQDKNFFKSMTSKDWENFGTKLESFYNANYKKFEGIFDDKTNTLTQFFKHAVIGWAVQNEVRKIQNYKHSNEKEEYDMMIGFWVSFWSERTGHNISFRSGSVRGPEGLETKIGLLDLTLIIKAIICKESSFNEDISPSSTGDYGLMQVNEKNFRKIVKESLHFENMRGFFNKDWRTDPFLNIGAGVGELFNILNRCGYDSGTILAQWIGAVWTYGPYSDIEKGKESLRNFFKFLKIYTGTRFTGLNSEEWYKAWAKYAHENWPKGGYPWPP